MIIAITHLIHDVDDTHDDNNTDTDDNAHNNTYTKTHY